MTYSLIRSTSPITSWQTTEGAVIVSVTSGGSDTPTKDRPGLLLSGDYSSFPFLTLAAAQAALPAGLRHEVLVKLGASTTFVGAQFLGFHGGGRLRIVAPYVLQTVSSGVNTGTANTGTTTTALKKPGAAGNWPTDGSMRGLLLVIDSGPGSNGDANAPVVRPIKDHTVDTLTFEAIPSLASGAVFRICLPATLLSNMLSPPSEVTNACLAITDCTARIEVHGIRPHDSSMDKGIYAARCSNVEAHGLDLADAASGTWRAIDCGRAALYDSRLKSTADAWTSTARNAVAERLYQDDARILIEYANFASAIVESRNCTGNAVKLRGGNYATVTLNANTFSATALVLEGTLRVETGGLTGTGTATNAIEVSHGTRAYLQGATIAGSGSELLIDGYGETLADAVNFASVFGDFSAAFLGGTGFSKSLSQGFALNSFINGGAEQAYGPLLLLGAQNTITAHVGGGQSSATKMAYRFTFVQAANDGDSVKFLGTPDILNTVVQESSGTNIGGHAINLFPPSGKHIYLNGVDQGADTAVSWPSGQRMIGIQDVSGNYRVTFIGGSTVAGPGSSTNTALARWNGTGGTTIEDSDVTLDGSGNMGFPSGGSAGTTSGDMIFKAAAALKLLANGASSALGTVNLGLSDGSALFTIDTSHNITLTNALTELDLDNDGTVDVYGGATSANVLHVDSTVNETVLKSTGVVALLGAGATTSTSGYNVLITDNAASISIDTDSNAFVGSATSGLSANADNSLTLRGGPGTAITAIRISAAGAVDVGATATDDDASMGYRGEQLGPLSRVKSAATALTSPNTKDVIGSNLHLTPGDWEVRGFVGFVGGSGTSVTILKAAISKTSATLPASDTTAVPTDGEVMVEHDTAANVLGTGTITLQIPPYRVTVATATTLDLFLNAAATFTASAISVFGFFDARRIR